MSGRKGERESERGEKNAKDELKNARAFESDCFFVGAFLSLRSVDSRAQHTDSNYAIHDTFNALQRLDARSRGSIDSRRTEDAAV